MTARASTRVAAVGFVKGQLITQIMQAQSWGSQDALFVDDSKEHIDKAAPVCRTLLVESRHTVGGMAQPEFDFIRKSFASG